MTPSDVSANTVGAPTEGTTIYKYVYNGLEMISDTELTEKMIQGLYNQAVFPSSVKSSYATSAAIGGPNFVPVTEPGSRMLTERIVRTNSNKDIEIVAGIIAAALWKKAPAKFSQSKYEHWASVPMTSWLLSVPTTYTGTWQTEAWNDYNDLYEIKNTLVHYKYSNFTTPVQVQYWTAGWSSTPTPR
ncbi:hypothetical protein ACOI1C_03765 [Bacillus sp. DJP31]|uniref:hypothetical protein n=1 Tax=Bacillus sp. DJP31 TaxID=3409789 RepID=UPI003BB4E3A9